MGPLTPHPSALSLPLQEGTMKDGIANNSTASISQARKAVEQLKMEACMDRIKVGSSKWTFTLGNYQDMDFKS